MTVFNCSCLALDLHRVFLFYWQLHDRDYIPSIWSKRVTALYGREGGLELQLNSSQAVAYVSVSNNSSLLHKAYFPPFVFLWFQLDSIVIPNPPAVFVATLGLLSMFLCSQTSPELFCPKYRTKDLDAIHQVIQTAKTFVFISVTDYLPLLSWPYRGSTVTRYTRGNKASSMHLPSHQPPASTGIGRLSMR